MEMEDTLIIYLKETEKLLLNKNELEKIHTKVKLKGVTIVPLRLFINEKGIAKIEIAVAKGKKLFDKRESLKEKDNKRDLDRIRKKLLNEKIYSTNFSYNFKQLLKKENIYSNESAYLNFSNDTILFDTIFSSVGSTTFQLTVYNNNNFDITTNLRLSGKH